ncbi:hypothetical protein TPHA_0E01850 [Tetrapisispora phaffii CBS 4417]|uniref:PX domain-containing protein n=1 Tax=Tetrapisispora phaffii (strain ATCC 24235 / CBS 4417 / NBRC 1672 / NRRL Y-8282 / UCD 70-5) TaxID=1071381 RepID=G8BTQ0_TETPH|nr:hypothetical protein TPHA_0E01850 [Tetrapisispora phaffii CBS 4417]CCE63278.1 hypothetical protein TPHA_0E01850 [Tetrapisispora phaffii CBS 4417]
MNNLKSVTPEPINLIDEENDDLEVVLNKNNGSDEITGIHKVIVSDYNIIENEIVVWKLTVVLLRRRENIEKKLELYKYKRFSDFKTLRDKIIADNKKKDVPLKFNLPELPPSVPWYNKWQYVSYNLNPNWLNKRQQGLEYFINYIICDSRILKQNKEIIYEFLNL